MMNIRIRNAVPSDCAMIHPLQKEIAQLHHAGRPDLFKTQARYFTQEDFDARLKNPAHTVFIAETLHGQVVGYAFAWVKACRNHSTYVDFDCFYIDDICVLKAWQKKGIGRQLLNACREKASALHCRSMELGVWHFNQDAIQFYTHCGFHIRTLRMEHTL